MFNCALFDSFFENPHYFIPMLITNLINWYCQQVSKQVSFAGTMKIAITTTIIGKLCRMKSLPKTRWLSIAAGLMGTPKTTSSCSRTRRSCCSNRTLVNVSMCKECAGRKNGSNGIPRTGLSPETKTWDRFRMRRLDGISSCIIVIITGKLNRGYLLENCCCYWVIKISRNTSSTGVLIGLKLGVEK